ncbi:MAG: phosphohydrolase [Candidatus Bathyarchaeota archaeon]|nr:phosphohydrolase [Candidatus Bathyarchaeota archaeon]
MVTVSNRLIFNHLEEPRVRRVFDILEGDTEVQTYLRMSNEMVVKRMNYNDHGPVHARIAAGSSLEILDRISRVAEPTTVANGICDLEGAKLITMAGSYLHDIGNSVHRIDHIMHSCYLAAPILDRVYSTVYPGNHELVLKMKCETLHAIYAHEDPIMALSIEAGAAKVADGTDMAEGRARIPYRGGKVDMHSISATSIKKVDIDEGRDKPVSIKIYMDNPAGVFQIEEVIGKKVETSGLSKYVELVAIENGREIKTVG